MGHFDHLNVAFFTKASIYPGSIGTFRYRFQREGWTDGKGTLTVWVYENTSFELAKDVESQTFPWTDEGVEQVKAWLEQKLEERGIFNQTAEYNHRLVALSRQAVDTRAWVAGDISPTGLFLSPLGEASFEELVDIYAEQAAGLEQAGVDLFVVETMMTLADARAAVLAIRSVSDRPVLCTFSFQTDGKAYFDGSADEAAPAGGAAPARTPQAECASANPAE